MGGNLKQMKHLKSTTHSCVSGGEVVLMKSLQDSLTKSSEVTSQQSYFHIQLHELILPAFRPSK